MPGHHGVRGIGTRLVAAEGLEQVVPVELEEIEIAVRHDGGGAGNVMQDGDLAERVPRPQEAMSRPSPTTSAAPSTITNALAPGSPCSNTRSPAGTVRRCRRLARCSIIGTGSSASIPTAAQHADLLVPHLEPAVQRAAGPAS